VLRLFSGTRHVSSAEGLDYRPLRIGPDAEIDPAQFQGCETLVHLAAYIPSNHDSIEEAARCWEVNALGTLRLAEAAARAGVQRFVHTTSANAYAPWIERPDERSPMFPGSRQYYLASKIGQELYAQSFCERAGISTATLRLSSVYGASQPHNVVARLARRLLDGDSVELADNGEFGADFVSVDDVSRALSLVVEKSAEGPFNVGSGVRTTIAELAEQLRLFVGAAPGKIVHCGSEASPDCGFAALDIGRLGSLGFKPRPIADALPPLVDALRDAPLG
jgi:UDP-glucose 4-epimerase